MKKTVAFAAGIIFAAAPFFAQTSYSDADLVWQDDFDGNSLNMNDWNYEYHEPGWVNNELQEYVDSKENIYVKDGNLVIQAVQKKGRGGKTEYTSGRINTRGKHDFKYGRIEARIKFPSGKGFLPAFWMMPTEENLYGQWPKCGEIDIAEVLGDRTDEIYGTLHYGEPHKESQGKASAHGKSFSDDWHIVACEWEPGEIRFYADGKMYHKENSWYTKRKGFGEVTYPAPFDQPFYIILNLAVGGNWPGNPDRSTKFAKNAQLLVDYVKVYQKKNYDENVKKPESENVKFRTANSDGNYILQDKDSWTFLLAQGGKGSFDYDSGNISITSEAAGSVDYSVQLVQEGLPMLKGAEYRLSFDASAEKERTIIAAVTAPEAGWIRYLKDTKINLGPQKKHFEFTFKMNDADDPMGRLEFNLGNQNSTAAVKISCVRLEMVRAPKNSAGKKSVLPDGNLVHNGEFQEGENRLAEWNVSGKKGAEFHVTNTDNIRKFRAENPKDAKIRLVQEGIPLVPGTEYLMSFDASSSSSGKIKAEISGKTFEASLSSDEKNFKFVFKAEKEKSSALSFSFDTDGTVLLDNVRIQENAMLVNGNFSSGLTGYEIYLNESASADYAVDSLSEDNAFCMNISDTGNLDWMIQLKQNGISLEKGKKYRIEFDAKSTIDRTIMYALQRDGSSDNNWIPYSGTQKIDVSKEFKRYSCEFTMGEPTDNSVILSISMGAVNDRRITQKHTVTVDNIVLEEIEN